MIVHCKCECGNTIKNPDAWGRNRKFIHGHSSRKHKIIKRPCKCGCGEIIITPDSNGREVLFKKSHSNIGSGSYLWKGEDAKYGTKHDWVELWMGKPNLCSKCNTIESKRFMWHNISEKYKRDLDDWIRLCAKCHANIHKNWTKQKKYKSL